VHDDQTNPPHPGGANQGPEGLDEAPQDLSRAFPPTSHRRQPSTQVLRGHQQGKQPEHRWTRAQSRR
jgi:hypothetical protein